MFKNSHIEQVKCIISASGDDIFRNASNIIGIFYFDTWRERFALTSLHVFVEGCTFITISYYLI